MANHSHLRLKKPIDRGVVEATILRTVQDVFLNLLEVKPHEEGIPNWWIGVPNNGYMGCRVWIQDRTTLVLRPGVSEFSSWVEWTLMGDLKDALGGTASNEGVGRIRVKKREFPTWKSYFDMLYGHHPPTAEWIWETQTACLTDEGLKKLASL